MAVLLSAADWADGIFKQLLIERLVNQAPMGLIGLLLMLLGSRMDQPESARPPIRWVVCMISALLAFVMAIATGISIYSNVAGNADSNFDQQRSQIEKSALKQSNEMLMQQKGQLDMAREQSANPENVKMLGNQLSQAGELPADASDEDKNKAAKAFIDKQLAQMETRLQQGELQRNLMEQQIQQGEIQRNLDSNKRLYGNPVIAVILAVAFLLLALAAVI